MHIYRQTQNSMGGRPWFLSLSEGTWSDILKLVNSFFSMCQPLSDSI